MLATVALAVVTTGLTSQTQGVGCTTGGLATHLAHFANQRGAAFTNVAGNLASTLDGLAKKSENVGHFYRRMRN